MHHFVLENREQLFLKKNKSPPIINKHVAKQMHKAEIITFLLLYLGCEIKRKTADGMEN